MAPIPSSVYYRTFLRVITAQSRRLRSAAPSARRRQCVCFQSFLRRTHRRIGLTGWNASSDCETASRPCSFSCSVRLAHLRVHSFRHRALSAACVTVQDTYPRPRRPRPRHTFMHMQMHRMAHDHTRNRHPVIRCSSRPNAVGSLLIIATARAPLSVGRCGCAELNRADLRHK